MNCYPHALAIFIAPGPLQGRIVKLTTLDPYPGLPEPFWLYEGERIDMAGGYGEYVSFRDKAMRPITPPPNTVTDEEVRELYRPRTVTPCNHKHRERV